MRIEYSSSLRRAAASLVEVLVVIAIIGVMLGMIIPAIQRVREAACRTQCSDNLRQLAQGVHHYESVAGRIPYNQWGPPSFGIGANSRAWSWLARLLPYIDQDTIYAIGHIPESTLAASDVISTQIGVFLCPSDSVRGPRTDAGNLPGVPIGQTNYKGVSGANWGDRWNGHSFLTDWRNIGTNGSFNGQDFGDGIFYRTDYRRPLRLADIADGTSNTFMIGEDIPLLDQWCSWPYSNNANGTCAIPPNVSGYPAWDWENCDGFRSRHPGGLQFAYADASVHFMVDGINLETYRALATISGGEIATPPE